MNTEQSAWARGAQRAPHPVSLQVASRLTCGTAQAAGAEARKEEMRSSRKDQPSRRPSAGGSGVGRRGPGTSWPRPATGPVEGHQLSPVSSQNTQEPPTAHQPIPRVQRTGCLGNDSAKAWTLFHCSVTQNLRPIGTSRDRKVKPTGDASSTCPRPLPGPPGTLGSGSSPPQGSAQPVSPSQAWEAYVQPKAKATALAG